MQVIIEVDNRREIYTYSNMNDMVDKALSCGSVDEETAAQARKNAAPVNIAMTNAELYYDLVLYSNVCKNR